jgi:hypothetical protein
MLDTSNDPAMDFDTAMHFATRSVRVLRMHLGAARWAQPDHYDVIEALIGEANRLEKRIEGLRTRAERDANDN